MHADFTALELTNKCEALLEGRQRGVAARDPRRMPLAINSSSLAYEATPGTTGTGQWLNSGGSSGADAHTLAVAIRPL
jgi:hypothetical protein